MIRATVQLGLYSTVDAQRALILLYRWNMDLIRSQPGRWPPLYESGVRYVAEGRTREGKQRERWLPIDQLFERGQGDCEDLSCTLAAQYTVAGIPAVPKIYRAGLGLYHVVVSLGGDRIEDPSAMLGMNEPSSLAPLDAGEDVLLQPGDRFIGGQFRRGARRVLAPVAKGLFRTAREVPMFDKGFDALSNIRDAARDVRDAAEDPLRETPEDQLWTARARQVAAPWEDDDA